jgi:hypothetical protein
MGFIYAEDQNWADDIDDRDSSEENCIKIRDDTHLDKEQSGQLLLSPHLQGRDVRSAAAKN